MDTENTDQWTPPAKRYVSTNQAAEALGINVSTIKRWVDTGILPATLTAGRHRRILVSDLLRLHQDRDFPKADLTKLQPDLSEFRAERVSQISDELYQALRKGDVERIRGLILGIYHRGCPMARLADEIIAPALHQVGHEWAAGRLTVLQEHHGTQFCLGALYELQAVLRTQAEGERPVAVGAAPERDHYLIPTLLAKMVMLECGWNAINLGPNTPMSALEMAIDSFQPRLIWLAVTHIDELDRFLQGYRAFHSKAQEKGVAVVVGGQGLTEEVRKLMIYETYCERMAHLAFLANTLHHPPQRPSRGRPSGRKDDL